MRRDPLLPGQESVWDYPRPPKLEPSPRHVRVELDGQLIADTRAAYRVMETSHPPSWYIPPTAIQMDLLRRENKSSVCEWKGPATYWTVSAGETTIESAAWSYEVPTPAFEPIKGHIAFYASRFECYVDGERVQPQPGGFYGGWVTKDIAGPFKGAPGTWGW